MNRRPRSTPPRSRDRDYGQPYPDSPRGGGAGGLLGKLNYAMIALIGGIFVLGIGLGLVFSSTASFSPENVASREVIDRSAPNAELCVQFGSSAIVSDVRIFVTLNPFHVFVTQPMVQPGCVLRRNNWSILEQQKLVDARQVSDCKNRMNTFGFTGPLEGKPRIDCIYQNEAAGNLFVNPEGTVGPRPATDKF